MAEKVVKIKRTFLLTEKGLEALKKLAEENDKSMNVQLEECILNFKPEREKLIREPVKFKYGEPLKEKERKVIKVKGLKYGEFPSERMI